MIRDEELAALLRAAPWMSEDGRKADRYERVDHAVLGSAVVLLVVAAVGGPAAGRRFFVPVEVGGGRYEGGGPREAHAVEEFHREAVRRTLAGGTLRTERGGAVEFRGAGGSLAGSPPEVRPLPFEQGWSSNALSLVEIGGVPHIHKTYRGLDDDVREPDLLRLMNGTGRTPEWAGDYAYTDPASGTRHPLGVVYRYAPGEGIDVPLRQNLRSLWPALSRLLAHDAPEAVARHHLRPLDRQLRDAGRFLRGFHADLADRLGDGSPQPAYPAGERLAQAGRRLADLHDRTTADPALPARVVRDAFTSLAAEVTELHAELDRSGPSWSGGGPCHGDLHLSHLLWNPPALIDLSTPSTAPTAPGWAAQSPLEDIVALQRGLEYFAADEAAFEAANRLGVDSLETMLGSLDAAPHLSPAQQAEIRRVFEVADRWRERVRELLLGPGAASDGPLRRLLYLRRLLHELAYNHAHTRPYHAAIDLRHALRLGGGSGAHRDSEDVRPC
ncbi:phosphotransferase [Streptomyces sp. PA5.6]|uniref:phosphotransferase n=1 Tax=Streptomyces sp. PA5.6 TaxID=3035651 RepID=UPI003904D96C